MWQPFCKMRQNTLFFLLGCLIQASRGAICVLGQYKAHLIIKSDARKDEHVGNIAFNGDLVLRPHECLRKSLSRSWKNHS